MVTLRNSIGRLDRDNAVGPRALAGDGLLRAALQVAGIGDILLQGDYRLAHLVGSVKMVADCISATRKATSEFTLTPKPWSFTAVSAASPSGSGWPSTSARPRRLQRIARRHQHLRQKGANKDREQSSRRSGRVLAA